MKKYRFNLKKFAKNQVKLLGVIVTVIMFIIVISGLLGFDLLPIKYNW